MTKLEEDLKHWVSIMTGQQSTHTPKADIYGTDEKKGNDAQGTPHHGAHPSHDQHQPAHGSTSTDNTKEKCEKAHKNAKLCYEKILDLKKLEGDGNMEAACVKEVITKFAKEKDEIDKFKPADAHGQQPAQQTPGLTPAAPVATPIIVTKENFSKLGMKSIGKSADKNRKDLKKARETLEKLIKKKKRLQAAKKVHNLQKSRKHKNKFGKPRGHKPKSHLGKLGKSPMLNKHLHGKKKEKADKATPPANPRNGHPKHPPKAH